MENRNVVEVSDLSFQYPSTEAFALNNLNFNIKMGEFVLLCGSSGSGKTTLAKCLNGIIPHLAQGDMYGEVRINGVNTNDVEIHELSGDVGMVFQNPEEQIFSIRVSDEVALGVECQGYTRKEIVDRVDYAMDKLRISDIKNRLIATLSGGQKQKVSIASNLAVMPNLIILDDPTTDLDPISKQEVIEILHELKNEVKVKVAGTDVETNMTFLVIEHELTDLLGFTDRVVVMHEGEIVLNGEPGAVFYEHFEYLDKIGVRIPDHIRFAKYLMNQGFNYDVVQYPLKKEEVMDFARGVLEGGGLSLAAPVYRDYTLGESEKVAEVKNISFKYPTSSNMILKNMSIDIYKGEFFAIVGHNGSGKSTLMKNILGLLTPSEGDVVVNGRNTRETDVAEIILNIGYVFQNPDNQLFCDTVREEVEFGLRNGGLPEDEIVERTVRALEIVELAGKEEEHPFSLSRGERQRLAVATMLVANPRIIMLDEPTTGLDERDLNGILTLMQELIEFYDGTTIMVTHDMEVVAKYATRIIVIDDGEIVLRGNPDEVFKNNYSVLEQLKLKPTIISEMTTKLADVGMPYIPYWKLFESSLVDAGEAVIDPEVSVLG